MVRIVPLDPLPIVKPDDDLAGMLIEKLCRVQPRLNQGDILVVTHKVVSKAEGCVIDLKGIIPSDEALLTAARCEKDARLVQVILDESTEVVRLRPGLIITRHRLGFICANAAVDASNVAGGVETVVTLPHDPDASAWSLRRRIAEATGIELGVLINDTHGRPFREAAVGTCIGLAGIPAVIQWTGRQDLLGYTLRTSAEAVADEVAAAATLVMGQSDEGIAAVLIRGLKWQTGAGTMNDLLRPRERDLFYPEPLRDLEWRK